MTSMPHLGAQSEWQTFLSRSRVSVVILDFQERRFLHEISTIFINYKPRWRQRAYAYCTNFCAPWNHQNS